MLLLIDNYDSFTYNLYQLMGPYASTIEVIRNDQLTMEMISQLQPNGIVLSPGPGRPESAGVCIEAVNEFSGRIPILGVCLGHQAIAVAFGGRVIESGEIVHGKPATVIHDGEGLYANMPQPFVAGRYHSLMVDPTDLPEVLSVQAKTEDGTIMGLKHHQHPTYGIQFHPESILTPEGRQLLHQFCQHCGEAS